MLINKIFLVGYFPNPLDPSKKKKKRKATKLSLTQTNFLKERLTKTAFCLLWSLDLPEFLFEETNATIMDI